MSFKRGVLISEVSFNTVYYFALNVQRTLRIKNVGTLSKKFKAPDITDEDRIRAASEVESHSIKLLIIDFWKKLRVSGDTY